MAGCVPVSWNIHGITDYIIEDKETGFLVEIGNYKDVAQLIFNLDSDRALLKKMSKNVIAIARMRFSNVITARDYAKLFEEVMSMPEVRWEPKSWAKFRVNQNFRTNWKDYIPISLKHEIKRIVNG